MDGFPDISDEPVVTEAAAVRYQGGQSCYPMQPDFQPWVTAGGSGLFPWMENLLVHSQLQP